MISKAWIADQRAGFESGGQRQASGGALRAAAWNEFVGALGFGPEAQVGA
jgi:hypothetical protein